MVSVTHSLVKLELNSAVPVAEMVAGLTGADPALVMDALAFASGIYAGRSLNHGEPVWDHALGTALILAGLRLDAETRAAGILFDAPNCLPPAATAAASSIELGKRFGAGIAKLVAEVAKVNRLRLITRQHAQAGLAGEQRDEAQIEILRKMLLAMAEDIRVVLVRLASRVQTLRFMARVPDAERQPVARETLDIYAPLANRLGVWQLKWELEDLSFRYLEPELYKSIARQLDERRVEREAFIADAISHLSAELALAGIEAEVMGRPKHLYSIWNKMRAKNVGLDEIYDVRALRVLVADVKDCYAALGVVHHIWQPIPKEFDDYISRPKGNFYRSLHTAVDGPDGRGLEVQIRTHDMHNHAELGVAAHWRYKEGVATAKTGGFDDKIAWLRQILAWKDEIVGSADWQDGFKRAALDDTVYVLTPQGRVIDLPRGSTAVDFAYHLHTDLGHRCRGARVDGHMVSLNTPLSSGQRVEIVTAKSGGPSRDWLNPQLGFLQSSRAKAKVRQYFKAQQHEETVAHGRAALEKELQREGATGANLEALAARLEFARPEELFAAIARGEVGPRQLQLAMHEAAPAPAIPADVSVPLVKSKAAIKDSGILVVGVDKLMTQLARCCKPAPPDPIGGFVTRGRGVSVHRIACTSFRRLAAMQPERIIAAGWGKTGGVFPADVEVVANDRQGLLRDLTEVLSREKINVTAVKTQSRQHVAYMVFTVEVPGVAELQRTVALLREVGGVTSAARRVGGS
jgi:GTP pyrophosphokinase